MPSANSLTNGGSSKFSCGPNQLASDQNNYNFINNNNNNGCTASSSSGGTTFNSSVSLRNASAALEMYGVLPPTNSKLPNNNNIFNCGNFNNSSSSSSTTSIIDTNVNN